MQWKSNNDNDDNNNNSKKIEYERPKKWTHIGHSFTAYKVLNKQMKCLLNYVPRAFSNKTIMFVMHCLFLFMPFCCFCCVIVDVFFLCKTKWICAACLMRTSYEYIHLNMYLCHTAPTPSANVLMFLYVSY